MGDVIEPAPSGRSKCRGCQRKIDKGELRYGEAVPNAFGAGDALHWYHPRCGAERRSEPFAAALEAHEGDVPERAELAELAAVGVAHPRWCRLARAERAPSGRARCQHCRDLIEKDALRIALERVEDGMTNPAGFVHVRCAGSYAGSTVGLLERLRRSSSCPKSTFTPDDWDAIAQELDAPITESPAGDGDDTDGDDTDDDESAPARDTD